MLNAIAGAVLGLLLGVAVVMLLTWMEADMLRTPAAIERALGVPVLGAIPRPSPRRVIKPEVQPGRVGAPKTA
jgi:capsular polysaccharide biosynthesis protein